MISTTQTVQPYAFTPGAPPATFAIPFAYQQTSEIKATLSQSGLADIALVQGVDYSVSAAPAGSGTFTRIGAWTAYAAYGNIVLYRQTALINNVSLINGGDIDATVLELGLDELTQMIQEASAATNILGKPLLFPLTDPAGISQYIPAEATRASLFLGFDSNGAPVAGSPSNIVISGAMTPVVTAVDLPTARVAMGARTVIATDSTMASGGVYLVTAPVNLTLPSSPTAGDRIDILAEAAARIIQSDANHGMNYRMKFWTTKGVATQQAGFLQLAPGTRVIISYRGSGLSRLDNFSKLTAPPAMTNANTKLRGAIALNFDGTHMVVGESATPFMELYIRSGDSWSKGAAMTAATAQPVRMKFSRDGTYLAIVMETTPFVEVYKRDSAEANTYTKLGALPAAVGLARDCSWSRDTNYLAVSNVTTPFIEVYKRTNDTFAKVTALTAATAAVESCVFSEDGSLLATGCANTPFAECYRRMGDVFTKLGALPALSSGVQYMAWLRDDTILACAEDQFAGGQRFQFYKRYGNTFVILPDPPAHGLGTPAGIMTSPDGIHLAVAGGATPFVAFYRRRGDSVVTLGAVTAGENPERMPSWSGDGVYCGFLGDDTTIAVYKSCETITKAWSVEMIDTGDSQESLEYLFR